jgi:hypothetical protein
MWRADLAVEFRKGLSFRMACECAFVPCDCIGEASDLWGNWCAAEQFELAA